MTLIARNCKVCGMLQHSLVICMYVDDLIIYGLNFLSEKP